MTPDRSAAPVYCLRGSEVCQTHRRAGAPWEGDINTHVGTLAARDDSLRRALVAAIWGSEDMLSIEDEFLWSELTLSASGRGADWKLAHGERILRVAEHKPLDAIPHWPIASKAAYRLDLLERTGDDGWIEKLTDGCSQPHSSEEYGCRHPWYYKGADRLCAPQPLAYLASARSDHGVMTLTVVTDRIRAAKTVNEIWDTEMSSWPVHLRTPSRLRADLFPVRSTVEFLTDLVDAIDLDALDDETYADVRALVEAMWVKEGCPEIAGRVRDVIRPGLEMCPTGKSCQVVSWDDYLGWSA